MASRASGLKAPHSQESLVKVLDTTPSGVVAGVLFPITGAIMPDPNLVWSALVMRREGGFMIAVPTEELVHQAILDLVPSSECAEPMFFTGEIQLTNSRGKVLGSCQAELVDLPWPYVANFSPAVQFRGAAANQYKVVGFSFGGQGGKPSADSLSELASLWLEDMDPLTAQEYVTGEELGEEEAAAVDPDIVAQLQERIAQLESMVKEQGSAPPVVPPVAETLTPRPHSPYRPMGLFQGGQIQSVSAQDWAKLKTLAGAPPPRVASVETRRPAQSALMNQQEATYAEMEKEAAEDELGLGLDPALLQTAQQNMDPMQQVLFAQLQQNQVLLQRLVGSKVQDPVLKALGGGSGSDSGLGSSSSGVRGCLAREVFLKAAADLPTVSSMVKSAAIRELGISAHRADCNLLRKYMERRVPLSEHRLLAQFGTLVTEGWSIGYQSGNEELMGFMGKMLIYVEQCALDSGRSQFAWLLTGIQEVPAHMLVSSKRKPGLEPFSRLCAPSWISANLQYIKDVDYMEARMISMTSGRPSRAWTMAILLQKQNQSQDPRAKERGSKGSSPPKPKQQRWSDELRS